MRVSNLIKKFCEENSDRYYVYENYSGRFMFAKTCLGIVVKNGFSHMEMLIKLTEYMNDADLSGVELEFSEGVSVDELGLDMIVYFPNVIMDNNLS